MDSNNLGQLYRSVIMDHHKNPRNRGILDNGSMITDMSNPACGDRIRSAFDIEDGIIKDVEFEGEGCSISMASASMMIQAVKGHLLGEAAQTSREFTKMMLDEDYVITEGTGDIEALQGISRFPARIKCVTLAWEVSEKGTAAKEDKTEGMTEEE